MGNCRWPFLVALLATGCSVAGLQQRTTEVVRKGPDSITFQYTRLWGSDHADSEARAHCERQGKRAVLRGRTTDHLDRHHVTYACEGQRTAVAEAASIREGARKALERPGVRSPFPCDDGWLSSGAGYVVDVAPWAEAAGLRRGDRLLAFDGVLISETGDWGKALERVARKDLVEVRVERGDRQHVLRLPCRESAPWWRAQRDLFHAMRDGKWGACLEAAQRLQDHVRRPFSPILEARVACWTEKAKAEGRPPPAREYSALVHQALTKVLDEVQYVPGGLAERRTRIVNGIRLLERLGRQDYASDVRAGLESASRGAAAPPAASPPAAKTTYRLGTGFAVRPDGLLVTAFHVIENARSVEVDCARGRMPAVVEQASPAADLATLRVPGASQPAYLPIADPRAARVGERVFTIGFPEPELLGTEPKFTEGVISSLSGPDNEASLMQITVPVHNGNSGGALVNEKGEVVGVVIATASAHAFVGRGGNPPQNVNWAVKGTYALPLFSVAPTYRRPSDRNGAIERAIRASCMVISEVGN